MIDNIDKIKFLLKFNNEDDFYHLQIIKRKKEHPELGNNSYIVKTYYVSSLEYLDRKYEEIKVLCNYHNARAGINLNKRSFEKLAFHTLKKVTDQIMNKDFKSVRKAYESVAGTYSNESDKSWILDFDFKDRGNFTNQLSKELYNVLPVGDKIKDILRTKNGFHVICKPFNVEEFQRNYTETWKLFDLHKDNLTILYIP